MQQRLIILLFLFTGYSACNVENPIPDPVKNPEYANWIIPKNAIINRGTPDDLIPSVDNPVFVPLSNVDFLKIDDQILGVDIKGEFRAYPIAFLNYHEVVNDVIRTDEVMISYCPLTGTGAGWNRGSLQGISSGFGISQYIYNSNHILYDRVTGGHWLPIVDQCVNGQLEGFHPDIYSVVETNWGTWKEMFPGSKVLVRPDGFSFNYDTDPYQNYRKSDTIYFQTNPIDNRLPLKERIHAIIVDDRAKIYRYSSFPDSTSLIMDNFQGLSVVIAGNQKMNFIVSFERRITNGPELEFIPNHDAPNIIMEDNEGNKFDIFGLAVAGPRKGQSLTPTYSKSGYWFALSAMYPDPLIN